MAESGISVAAVLVAAWSLVVAAISAAVALLLPRCFGGQLSDISISAVEALESGGFDSGVVTALRWFAFPFWAYACKG